MGALNTSEHGGWIRYSPTRMADADPLSTARVRDGIVNNLTHTLDSVGQSLININGRTAGKASWVGLASSSLFTRAIGLPPIPVVLHPLPDGTSTRVVVSIDAYITIAGTATFRFVLSPSGSTRTTGAPPAAAVGLSHICELSTSSTSVVELGPASMYVDARSARSPWWRNVPTRDGVESLASTPQLEAQLEIWCFSSSTGVPTILSLNAREFCA